MLQQAINPDKISAFQQAAVICQSKFLSTITTFISQQLINADKHVSACPVICQQIPILADKQ